LSHFYHILDRLRIVCSDHAKLAAEEDRDYQNYSPYLNQSMFHTNQIEYDIHQPLPHPSATTLTALISQSPLKWFKSRRPSGSILKSWKWALLERRKFEQILGKFQKLNQKLKDLLPLSIAAKFQSNNSSKELGALAQDENAKRVGLAQHARLRQIVLQPEAEENNFILQDVILESPQDSNTLVVAALRRQMTGKRETVLVEYKDYLPEPDGLELLPPSHIGGLRQLAALLASSGGQDLGTLPFVGLVDRKEEERHAFIFQFPQGASVDSPPESLHSMIEDSEKVSSRLTLSSRFTLAQAVSKRIGSFHADGWVHKSIRSESIVFFLDQTSQKPQVKSPYLVNFEYSRPETAATRLDVSDDPEKNLYRHPDRQGVPRTSFSKLHDLYSLGIVLLEIGVWQTAGSLFEQSKRMMKPGVHPSPRGIKSIFVKIAKDRLPHHMGDAYLDAVLICLDEGFQDLTSRADYPMLFHENVVEKLDIENLK
jgi:hypothetical protein